MLSDPLSTPARLLEVAHVAHRLSISPGQVRKLIRALALPAIRFGTRYRVDPKDLERFIEAHRITTLQQQIEIKAQTIDASFPGVRPRGPSRAPTNQPTPVGTPTRRRRDRRGPVALEEKRA